MVRLGRATDGDLHCFGLEYHRVLREPYPSVAGAQGWAVRAARQPGRHAPHRYTGWMEAFFVTKLTGGFLPGMPSSTLRPVVAAGNVRISAPPLDAPGAADKLEGLSTALSNRAAEREPAECMHTIQASGYGACVWKA